MDAEPSSLRADTGLAWGVKGSFVDYIARLGDSIVDITDGAFFTSTREFYFPVESTADFDVPSQRGTLRFRGTVSITAHFGALQLELTDPFLDVDGALASLCTPHPSGGEAQRLALIDLAEPTVDGDVLMWADAPARLAVEATVVFGGVYPPGEVLDPVTLRIPRSTPPVDE